MCESVGHPVRRLVRTRIGAGLGPGPGHGEWRHLSAGEIRLLWEAASSPGPARKRARPHSAPIGPERGVTPWPSPGPAQAVWPAVRGHYRGLCMPDSPLLSPSVPPHLGPVRWPSRCSRPRRPGRVRALRGATTVDEDNAKQVTMRTIALVQARSMPTASTTRTSFP